MRLSIFAAALLCAALSIPARADEPAAGEPAAEDTTLAQATKEMSLLFKTDFADGNIAAWNPTDPKAWQVVENGGKKVYALTGKSDYTPPVRSPLNISLLKGLDVSDFVFELKLRSTTKDYNHRDLCIIFGHQDPSHFYYAHLALHADEHANSIFLVNGAPRASIAKTRTEGTVWTDDFHRIRVVRKTSTGSINVFFDDMKTPVMTASDKAFMHGLVGIGSFDDTGEFAEASLWGKPAFSTGANTNAKK